MGLRRNKINAADVVIYAILVVVSFTSLFPVLNTLAISLSSSGKASAGVVTIFPIGLNFESYKRILTESMFFNAFFISVKRVVLSTSLSFFIIIMAAYPLSKTSRELPFRNVYMWFFVATMMFGPGLIPTFLNINSLNLMGSIWALVLPGLANQYLIVLVMNNFRSLPKELDECSSIDGAGPWRKLFQIYLPLSKPIIATVMLFTIVGNWNSFFDGLIYMKKTAQYPLQTYIQQMIVSVDPTKFLEQGGDIKQLGNIMSSRTLNASKLIITMLPILMIYPILQKYFVKGIMLGSVKG